MLARRTEPNTFRGRRIVGKWLDRWAVRLHSAFIREKTWGRAEKPAPLRPTMENLRKKFVCCATTAKLKNIVMKWKDITAGWTLFRPGSCKSNSGISQVGIKSVARKLITTVSCFGR